MINKLIVKNFKSIKELSLACKKINVFIGEPNVGKSNILEAIAMFSYAAYSGEVKEFTRCEKPSDLFYLNSIYENIKIQSDDNILTVKFNQDNTFSGVATTSTPSQAEVFRLSWDGQTRYFNPYQNFSSFKFYRFKEITTFSDTPPTTLRPPNGDNLLNVIFHDRQLKELIDNVLKTFNLKMVFEPGEQKLKIRILINDMEVLLPYNNLAEGLRRLIFYISCLYSNANSILVFEEPESATFPYYTRYLAECIAFDDQNNQFFISTHNPYFLSALIEKADSEKLAVNITYLKDQKTHVKTLTYEEIQSVCSKGEDLLIVIEQFVK